MSQAAINASTALLRSAAGDVTPAGVEAALKAVGVRPGATLMLHSRLFGLGRLGAVLDKDLLADGFIDAVLAVLGPEGTLLVPTFSFSFCKTGLFDVDATPSEMGTLTERARKRPDARRSGHPIYSVAAFGREAERYLAASDATCFGPDSPFDRLHQASEEGEQVILAAMGLDNPAEAITYSHYLEETAGVPYRYHKTFSGVVRRGQTERQVATAFYVRDLERNVEMDWEAAHALWREAGIVACAALGDGHICAVAEPDLYATVQKALKDNPNLMLAAAR